jgi:hypothetical protein
MNYQVLLSKKAYKNLQKMPIKIQNRYDLLHASLIESGPLGPHKWPNFSKLNTDEYHCHLDLHHVACWKNDKNKITIEVYYVGSREDAPY